MHRAKRIRVGAGLDLRLQHYHFKLVKAAALLKLLFHKAVCSFQDIGHSLFLFPRHKKLQNFC